MKHILLLTFTIIIISSNVNAQELHKPPLKHYIGIKTGRGVSDLKKLGFLSFNYTLKPSKWYSLTTGAQLHVGTLENNEFEYENTTVNYDITPSPQIHLGLNGYLPLYTEEGFFAIFANVEMGHAWVVTSRKTETNMTYNINNLPKHHTDKLISQDVTIGCKLGLQLDDDAVSFNCFIGFENINMARKFYEDTNRPGYGTAGFIYAGVGFELHWSQK